jgi:hypothetical protein
MTLDDMIAVLEAAKRGEKIEYKVNGMWCPCDHPVFNFYSNEYRIAPKKEMTLVEELRIHERILTVCGRAADKIVELRLAVHNRDNRITELEQYGLQDYTTDELLAELKRRTT